MKYKKSLLLYGNYCSDMPKAQERLEEVTRRNENIRTQIEASSSKNNDYVPKKKSKVIIYCIQDAVFFPPFTLANGFAPS